MTNRFDTEAVVIGAGAVGLACAAALARQGLAPIVLERAGVIGSGTSSRNSEVVHAGLYYPTGTLKHRLCVRGRRLLYPYMAARGVKHWRCGKLVVATDARERAKIEALAALAAANDVENVAWRTGPEAMAMEPALTCVGALFSPETGVMDSHGLMLALQGEIEDAGGAIAFHAEVTRVALLPGGGFRLEAAGAEATTLTARILINSAGLAAPALARRIEGLAEDHVPRQTLAKGSYFGCATKPVFSRLIYPAPVDGGLGVHVTLDLAGRMRFGPDVEWLDHDDPERVDYAVDPRRCESFYAAVRRYWPGLPDGAITPDYSGCRPKLSRSGEPPADFRVDGPERHGIEGLVNLFGIESPGLTSSLAIGELVAARLEGRPDPV